MKNKKSKDTGSDSFYDRIHYYETRNIFSSNEPVDPENRLYTTNIVNTNSVWNRISNKNDISLSNTNEKESTKVVDDETAKNLINNVKKYSMTNSSTACRLCGYVGHLAYQCRNNFKIKNGILLFYL